MKRNLTFLFCLTYQLVVFNSWGQQKLALEQIQVYSSIHPTASYWKLPSDIHPILNALDSGILLELGLTRDTNVVTKALYLTKQNQLGKININWSATRDYNNHAYLELYEMDPDFIFKNNLVEIPDDKKDSIHSFWLMTFSIFNQKQQKRIQKTIILGLAPVASLGIGFANQASASTPYHIYNAIVQSLGRISTKEEAVTYLEAKLPFAYTTDNYWMPYVHNQPRVLFDTSKNFISYIREGKTQLLRTPTAIFNKIDLKDKNNTSPYKNIIARIKKKRINYANNEYYQVIQHVRDVNNDLDYNIEGYLEFNTDAPGVLNQLALVFLNDSVHKIYNDKDSIGYFMVKDLVTEKDKYYFSEIIYNGYDSTKQYALGDKMNYTKYPIMHLKSIDGKMNNTSFSIKLSADNTIKTIFIDDKLSFIISGKEKPTQMVIVNKQVPSAITNFLIMLSFSEIFQNPN